MADVRSLLKNERTARRIQHKHASYSPTGTLLCTVCHLQLKSETLWEPHLRSASHISKAQKALQAEKISSVALESNKKKRKADNDDSEGEGTIRKRTKAANGLPEGFFDAGGQLQTVPPPIVPPQKVTVEDSTVTPPLNMREMSIPSRPATPSKPIEEIPKRQGEGVDEDEWAAFEADIAKAETEVQVYEQSVISAPAMSAKELVAKDKEEESRRRRERVEAEAEGDKEDAARKLEEEFEEMESLEQRVRRLREKREALRLDGKKQLATPPVEVLEMEEGESEDEDDEDDEWDAFRMK